jgi:hypothetical protein
MVGRSGLMVGGGVGYWWILSVALHLDASVGSISSVASLGLSSSLGHGGRQMLGLIAEGYLSPNTKVGDKV